MAGVADQVLLVLWLLILVVVALASLAFLPRARQLADRERDRATAEYDAFDAFLSQLQGFSTVGVSAVTEPAGGSTLIQQRSVAQVDGLAKVRDAYRETVMAVAHYEEDYNETLVEHMSAEFGDEIAHTAVGGGPLLAPIKRNLVESARDARDRRADFIELLDEESESLTRHDDQLAEIKRRVDKAAGPRCSEETYNGLHRRRARLQQCATDVESVIDRRQQDRTEGRTATVQMMDGADLQEYLYRPMEVTYPVLAEGAKLLSQIEVGLRRIEDELIYRS